MSDNGLGELIEEAPKSRFGKLRQRIREKKQLRRAEKERIKGIAAEERGKLEREFIRRRERMKLSKKFTPQVFSLGQAQRKRALQKLARPVLGSGRPAGEQILSGIGGFGVRPALSAPPKRKPRKRKKQEFFLIRA